MQLYPCCFCTECFPEDRVVFTTHCLYSACYDCIEELDEELWCCHGEPGCECVMFETADDPFLLVDEVAVCDACFKILK